MTKEKCNSLVAGYSAAIVSAVLMLLLGIFGNLGIYMSAVEEMQKWHMFFSLSIGGIIAGMLEAAVIGFVIMFSFAWVYNKLNK